MKIIDAISKIDSLKHNTYSQNDKIGWMSDLDWIVKREVIDTHEGAEQVHFTGYDENTDQQTVLLIPAPYDTAYLLWMEAQIDYYNGEYGKYNNAMEMFNETFEGFKNYYNRNHMPKGSKIKFF